MNVDTALRALETRLIVKTNKQGGHIEDGRTISPGLENVPAEALIRVFQDLDDESKVCLGLTCKRFRTIYFQLTGKLKNFDLHDWDRVSRALMVLTWDPTVHATKLVVTSRDVDKKLAALRQAEEEEEARVQDENGIKVVYMILAPYREWLEKELGYEDLEDVEDLGEYAGLWYEAEG